MLTDPFFPGFERDPDCPHEDFFPLDRTTARQFFTLMIRKSPAIP